MAKANSVHSTPPTNTSARHSRRSILGAIVATGAVAAAIPTAVLAAAPAVDPIYAVIAVHRNALIAHMASLELQTRFERRYGIGKGGWISTKPCHEEDDAFTALVAEPTTTVQGLFAKLAYFDELVGEFETEWMIRERAEAAVLIQSFAASLKNIGVQPMSCEIIQLSAFSRSTRPESDKHPPAGVTAIGNRALTPRQRRREGKPELPPPATEIAKSSRIRITRRDAWWHADRVADYWRGRLDWHHGLEIAQQYGIADSASFPSAENENRSALVDKWRVAVAKKLLTPAPDLGAITWKRAKLKSSDLPYLPVKKERVERAIADDVAFLEAHPTRAKRGTS
jgi:hypothetical protein